MRVVELALLVVVIGQVEHDGTSFEDALIAVFESGNAAIGVNGKEPVLLLGVFRDVDLLGLVL